MLDPAPSTQQKSGQSKPHSSEWPSGSHSPPVSPKTADNSRVLNMAGSSTLGQMPRQLVALPTNLGH